MAEPERVVEDFVADDIVSPDTGSEYRNYLMEPATVVEQPCSSVDPVVEPSASEIDNESLVGWITSLRSMPAFTDENLNKQLISDGATVRPAAYRNKLAGYKMWKEAYVSKVRCKTVTAGDKTLFIVRAFVSAAMKCSTYTVYCHLDTAVGDVTFAKCGCKAGQGGCCKHVAAVLYTLVDYSNLKLTIVPEEVTCTQVLQKWSVPRRMADSSKAVKFEDLSFEKASAKRDASGKRKHPIVCGGRQDYCATPSFAATLKPSDLENMCEGFENASKANLFTMSLKGNNYKPCSFFETSSSRMLAASDVNVVDTAIQPAIDIFHNFSDLPDLTYLNNHDIEQQVSELIALSRQEARDLEVATRSQGTSAMWFRERSKRLTSSLFGTIINRRETIYPKSIVEGILRREKGPNKRVPLPMLWGIENENVAIKKYGENSPLSIHSCGFVVNPLWPWLGASPDSLLSEAGKLVGALEIKCPYSKRDLTIAEACSDKAFFLKQTDSGPKLKERHMYYYQCQGVMNIADIPWLDFVVYTPKDYYVQRIERDVDLWNNLMLPKLTKFFTDFLLPKLSTDKT